MIPSPAGRFSTEDSREWLTIPSRQLPVRCCILILSPKGAHRSISAEMILPVRDRPCPAWHAKALNPTTWAGRSWGLGHGPPSRHLLDSGFRQMAAIPESAKVFMSGLIERARKLKKTIVFPEGTDARVLEAAARLAREGVLRPVLIGARPANAPEGVEFVDPANSPLVKKYAALYYERRKAKGTTQVEAAAVAQKPDR